MFCDMCAKNIQDNLCGNYENDFTCSECQAKFRVHIMKIAKEHYPNYLRRAGYNDCVNDHEKWRKRLHG